MILVHHETTTGRLNQLREIGQICRDNDIGLYLDGVSSFGAEDIRAHEINLKAVAASANNVYTVHLGLHLFLHTKDQWEKTADKSYGVYFDLHQYYGMQKRDGFSPYTQATHLVSASS